MKRRDFTFFAGAAVSAPSALHAQPLPNPRRVGSLSIASQAAAAPFYDAFKDGMRELGWVEGRNVAYRFLFADGRMDRLDALAGELLAQGMEVIVVGPPQAARALQKATTTVPIVMTNVSNAVGSGFIASLARPGGNITGITAQNEVVLAKLIELLHAAVPSAQRIAVLVNEGNPSHRAFWLAAQDACAALRLVPLRLVANAPDQLEDAVAAAQRERA
jgi:putative tryptophan/tyrosine transport system substrate-binding protein